MLSKEKRKNEKSILKLTEVPEIFKGRCGRGYRISQRKRSNPVLIQSPSTYTLIHITHTHSHLHIPQPSVSHPISLEPPALVLVSTLLLSCAVSFSL